MGKKEAIITVQLFAEHVAAYVNNPTQQRANKMDSLARGIAEALSGEKLDRNECTVLGKGYEG